MNKIKLLLVSLLMCSMAYAGEIKELKIIVPTSPGGTGDLSARIIQGALAEEMKIPVIVEFKLGAGGMIASTYVNNAPQSEKLLYLSALGIISNALKDEDYAKISNVSFLEPVGYGESILVMSKKSGIKNWNDFLRVSNTKQLAYGSAGVGTTPHVFVEIAADKLNRKFIHVPFKGQAPIVPMLLSGDIDFALLSKATVMQHIQTGSMIPIAVVSRHRDAELPNIPTLSEKKILGIEDYNWMGAFTNQPQDSEDYRILQTQLHKALQNPKVISQLNEIGYHTRTTNVKSNSNFIAHERQRLIKDTQSLKLD